MMSDFERIWLIDTGEAARVWCDSPDPTSGIDPEDVTGPYILNADQRIEKLEAAISVKDIDIKNLREEVKQLQWTIKDMTFYSSGREGE